jgi:hypothetical protein
MVSTTPTDQARRRAHHQVLILTLQHQNSRRKLGFHQILLRIIPETDELVQCFRANDSVNGGWIICSWFFTRFLSFSMYGVNEQDLRVYTLWRAEWEHFTKQQLKFHKQNNEWEMLGELALRLHHRVPIPLSPPLSNVFRKKQKKPSTPV